MPKYRTNVEQLSSALKALANPSRLRIYTRLVACCAPSARYCAREREIRACVGELGKDLGISPSTVSHHISQLRNAGLIHMERRGQNVECSIAPEALHMLATFFGQLDSGELSGRGERRSKGKP